MLICCFCAYVTGDIHIKTEYGDEFKVVRDSWGDTYWIEDKNSYFNSYLYYLSDKRDFHSVCDNQYFRCYYINDSLDNDYITKLYILKIKKYNEFFSIRYENGKRSGKYMLEDNAEKVKSEFLCDALLMKICLDDLDHLYHDEMLEIGNKLINHEFDELEQYGLTKDMISDTESLNEKITIMENYLKKYQ